MRRFVAVESLSGARTYTGETDYDLCEDCQNLSSVSVRDENGKRHLHSHPVLKCSRPVIEFESFIMPSFSSMFARLQEEEDLDFSSSGP
jgi:hypothetical protein